jgi:uncharacterized protein YbaP (TraB family)
MRRTLLRQFLFLLVLVSAPALAQDNNRTLLWRITGNGLEQPSYLFGTMHLSDKRLFRFDDSVYAAIERVEGLATELNMNELAAYYANKMLDDQLSDERLEDLLTQREIKDLQGPLTKKFNKQFKDITTRDVLRERNKWLTGYFRKGEMPTFVDAYLFDLAYRQGKWVGGVEDLEDQTKMMDGTDVRLLVAGEENTSVEKLIRTYANQDIEGINKRINNNYGPEYKNIVLTRRNIKMARRMDSLSELRSMFFAVGAAHLPGDSGVISLLRSRGFTVEPVFSKTKISADDYKCPAEVTKWYEVDGQKNLYTVEMPGSPASVKIYGLVEMKFLVNFSNMSGYCAMATISPDSRSDDSIFATTAYRIYQKKKLNPPQEIMKSGVRGVEYLDTKDGLTIRMQLFRKENVNYAVWIYGSKEEYVMTDNADTFFHSLKLTPPTTKESSTYTFTDSVMAIRFQSPARLETNENLSRQTGNVDGWDVSFCSGQEENTGAYIMVISKQVKAGSYIANDSVILDELYNNYKVKYKAVKKSSQLNGYNALTMDGEANDFRMQAMTFVRGNKNIAVLAVSEKGKDNPAIQQLFKTMQLLPYKQASWRRKEDQAHTYSALVPGPFRLYEEQSGTSNKMSWYSHDTFSATSYYVTTDTLNKYTWAANDSVFLNKKATEYVGSNDSIIYQRVARDGFAHGIDILVQKNRSNSYQRIRVMPHGKVLYILSAGGDKSVLLSATSNRYFTSFKPLRAAYFNLKEYKGTRLIQDLNSRDSATRYEAYSAVSKLTFEKADLPLLHKAMFSSYRPVYAGDDSTRINFSLAYAIGNIGDKSSVRYVTDNYSTLTGDKDKIKYCALATLAKIKTAESYTALAKLAHQWPAKEGNYQYMQNSMADSLPLLKQIYPTLLQLLPDTRSGLMAAALVDKLNDSGLLKKDELRKAETGVLELSRKLLDDLTKNEAKDWNTYNVLYLLDSLNSPASINMLRDYLSVKNTYLKKKAAIMLLDKGTVAEEAVWQNIAADASARARLYDELKEQNKEDLFPSEYLTQKLFAESAMYEVAEEDGMEPVEMKPIAEQVGLFNNKKYKFYLYKITFKDYPLTYLGVSGGYAQSGKSVEMEQNVTGIYWKAPYTGNNEIELLNSYIELAEEYVNNKGE